MNTNQIKLNETVYELHRVYSSETTVADIIKQRLTSTTGQIKPLTAAPSMVYNNIGEAGMSKEVK